MAQRRVLPYSRQALDDDDVAAVVEVLRGDWLTTGPKVQEFEHALALRCGATHALSCASGTAALHLACLAMGLGPEHSVIVPTMTFAATANAARLVGAEIIFADCNPETGLMGPAELEAAIERAHRSNRRPAAVFPVDLAGQCEDLESLAEIAHREDMVLVEDACHSLGTRYRRHDGTWHPVGCGIDADMTVFSFHPVKNIAAGEGGAVLTQHPDFAQRLARFRNHGVNRNPGAFTDKEAGFDDAQANPWYYEMVELGLNYRLSDINCALALSQSTKLDKFVAERRRLTARYEARLKPLAPLVQPIARAANCMPAWHLMSVLIDFEHSPLSRGQLVRALEGQGIRTQVHYIPVHRHPYYRDRYGAMSLPGAEAYYRRTLSLPLFVGMTPAELDRVVEAISSLIGLRSTARRRLAP